MDHAFAIRHHGITNLSGTRKVTATGKRSPLAGWRSGPGSAPSPVQSQRESAPDRRQPERGLRFAPVDQRLGGRPER